MHKTTDGWTNRHWQTDRPTESRSECEGRQRLCVRKKYLQLDDYICMSRVFAGPCSAASGGRVWQHIQATGHTRAGKWVRRLPRPVSLHFLLCLNGNWGRKEEWKVECTAEMLLDCRFWSEFCLSLEWKKEFFILVSGLLHMLRVPPVCYNKEAGTRADFLQH